MKIAIRFVPILVMLTCVYATCNKVSKISQTPADVVVHQDRVPVLVGKTDNQLVRVRIAGRGKTLTGLSIRLTGTTRIQDIKILRLYDTGSDSVFNTRALVATAVPESEKVGDR